MRLFLAIDPGAETRRAVASMRQALAAAVADAAQPPRVAWVKDEAAHVTLRFIGEQEAGVVERLVDALAAPLGVAPFTLEWTHLGSFPASAQPRVVWMGAARGGEAFDALVQRLDERLDPIVEQQRERAARPHITIGRVKERGHGIDWPALLAATACPVTVTTVDHVTLYASRLSAQGPTYTAVNRVSL